MYLKKNGKIPSNPFKYTIDGKEVTEEIFTNYNLEDYPKVKKLEQTADYDEILTHIPCID
jgi:hypothetical protein